VVDPKIRRLLEESVLKPKPKRASRKKGDQANAESEAAPTAK